MKKIYLLALSMLIGNFLAISETTIEKSNDANPKKSIRSHVTSSDQAIDKSSNYQATKGKRGMPQPVVSNNSNAKTRATCSFSDNFNGANDTASLRARGYRTYYRGGGVPGTSPTWFQGDGGFFPAYNGPANGYLASDYNTVTGTNDVNNWIVLPSMNLTTTDVFSFYSRSPVPGTTFYPDSLHVWYSAAGDSLPESLTWVLLGEFEVNVLDMWEFNSFPIPTASPNGRLAIQYALVDAGPTGANSLYVGIDQITVFTPSSTDGSLTQMNSPITGCVLTASEPVTVVIENAGSTSISNFNVSYILDGGTPVTEVITDTIAPGGSFTYTFTALADLSTTGSHDIDASVSVTNDSNVCNDLGSFVVRNNPLSNPLTTAYTMGFELIEDFSAWKAEDVDGDGVTWALVDTVAHSGSMCMRKAGSGQADDDWLFSGCLDLVGGTTYTLDYWYKIFDNIAPCDIETYLASDQSALSVGQLIIQDPLPGDTLSYAHSISTFSPQNSGTYYLAFHAYSAGGSSSIRLDDINLDDGTSIGINENVTANNVSIYPNPTTGEFYLNSLMKSSAYHVDVFNLSGQKVYSSKLNNLNQQRIDLSKQAKGVYTVRITSDSFVENHSVIITR